MKLRLGEEGSGDAGFSFRSSMPVCSVRSLLAFLRRGRKMRSSPKGVRVSGVGGGSYGLIADFGAREFTVSSTWVSETAFRSWVRSPAHREAVSALRRRAEGSVFDAAALTH